MDVAILAAARFPINEPFAGGMEAHTHVLAERLWSRGHRVSVYAAGGTGPYQVEPMLPVTFRASAAARRDVSAGPEDALAEHHSYLDAILRLRDRGHDVIHLNAVHHLPYACARLLSGSIVTATLHAPPTPWLESALRIATAGDAAPAMVSVSAANARAWHDVPVHGVIANGIDLQQWSPGPGGDGAAWWGRIVPEKAPHLAIDAARRAGLPISVIGPVHDPAYFAAEITPRLGAGVTYEGHLSTRATAEIVGRCAVALATPVWDEPFGLVVAEAMACGTPVVAFDRGAMAELIDATTGRVVAAGDVDLLADAALDAVANVDRAACRRTAERRFAADVMADAYEAWFQSLLARRAGGQR